MAVKARQTLSFNWTSSAFKSNIVGIVINLIPDHSAKWRPSTIEIVDFFVYMELAIASLVPKYIASWC